MAMTLRVPVARSARRERRLWTGRPSSVLRLRALAGQLFRLSLLQPATFFTLLVDALSIFLVVALPPSKDLFPVRLVPTRIISTALFAAFLALAFVIGNAMLAVLSAPCLKIGAAPFPPV